MPFLRSLFSIKSTETTQAVAGAQRHRHRDVSTTSQPKGKPYVYDPLDKASLRLLLLEPGRNGTPLSCALQHVPIERAKGTYLAVSYTWGDARLATPISVGGDVLSVTLNLFNALHRIRNDTQPQLVWADAVCINQRDNQEKGWQVPLMGKIFQNAKRVVIWLAPASSEAQEAAVAVQKVADTIYAQNKKVSRATIRVSNSLEQYVRNVAPLKLPPPQSRSWRALDWFFSLPWFYRIWVIQEVAGSRDAAILCGTSHLDWFVVCLVAAWVEVHTQYIHENISDFTGVTGAYNATFMYPSGRSYTWLDLLDEGREFEATDPRDKVFALMGHSNISCGRDHGTVGLEADYRDSNTRDMVYCDVTRRHIEQSKTLDSLCLVDHGSHVPENGRPTWAPRFDKATANIGLSIDENIEKLSASAGRPVMLTSTSNPFTLRVSGVSIDRIASTTSNLCKQTCGSESDPMVTMWLEQALNERRHDNNDEDLQLAIALAVTIGALHISEGNRKTQLGADCASYLLPLVTQALQRLAPAQQRRYQAALTRLGRRAIGGQASRFAKGISHRLQRRRLFSTTGGSIGIGPEAMQANDELCVMPGATVPLVLRYRQRTDTYALVGEAFVDGVMRGEAFQGRRPIKDFTLC